MRIIADLHIHSRFSRACSKALTFSNIDKWARIKGIGLVATGDITHPKWVEEIKSQLEDLGTGFFQLKANLLGKDIPTNLVKELTSPKFVLATELSCIYSKTGKTRRIHICFLFPTLTAVEKFNAYLDPRYNIKSDGRPILGIDVKELTKIALEIDPKILVYPAHIWTPWFSIFGSKSGFDKFEDCFEEYSEKIYAIETGLSSDPPMNWRLSQLDRFTILSHSDAHSAENLGREADVFDFDQDYSYQDFYDAIRNKDHKRLLYTIEFHPEEGMYHYDGHRLCQIRFSPEETRKHKSLCPKCGKSLTVGVMNRVEQLADRPEGGKPKDPIAYKSLVPLSEIIADAFGAGKKTQKVDQEYQKLISVFGSEFEILLDVPLEKLKKQSYEQVAEGIRRVREGELYVEPGYDGQYGVVKVFKPEEQIKTVRQDDKQSSLF